MFSLFSEWQRIDLHIHTDASRKTKHGDYEGTFCVDTLYNKLIENKVKIFSLTDHNIINIGAYTEYYSKYNGADAPLLLVGAELDITRNGKTYHSLLIFNYCSTEKAQAIYERLEKYYEDKEYDIFERKISIDDIITVFPDDDFFFIPHAGNTASIVDGYKGEIEEAQKMLILLQSPLEKVDAKRRAIYNEGFDKVIYEAFRNKDDYAYIEFSDNHNIAKYPCKHKGDTEDHIFYYIKGSKNYETLRLAFIDPKSRIKSEVDYSSIYQSFNYVEKISIKNCEKIEDTDICFSPHLNVIIGGRSSGKSLLLDMINRKIETLSKNSNYDSILSGANVQIKACFDADFKDTTAFNTTIVQINQGDIVNYFENSHLEMLAQKSGKYTEYISAKNNLTEKKSQLQSCVDNLLSTYHSAYNANINQSVLLHQKTIEMLLSQEYVFKCNTEQIEGSYPSKDEIKKADELINALHINLESLLKNRILQFNESEMGLINGFKQMILAKKSDLELIKKNHTYISSFLRKITENITLANTELSKEGRDKATAHDELSALKEKTATIFSELIKLNKSITSLNAFKIAYKEQILLDGECSLCLEVQSDDKVPVCIIDAIKSPGTEDLYTCFIKLLEGRVTVKNYNTNIPDNLKRKITTQMALIYSKFDHPRDFLEYSDGSTSKNNSPGFNSEKYLQVILNNPNSKLVLIDQPEDNLGNQFISEKMVDIIRSLKFKKQFFLATHNPAIVVYGDAECIVMAQNNANKIFYTQSKLETENSQKDICGILDGGEYIFHNRAQKYNIPKLLQKEN